MAAPQTILSFAYGSNMLTRRLRERAPSAQPRGCAILHGRELKWHKQSIDGSGKCDVVVSPHGTVYGVLYEIATNEKTKLDAAEGLGTGYDEEEVTVETSAGAVKAWLYSATNIDQTLQPYSWYKALVVAGAKEHALPAEYVAVLEATPAIQDADSDRKAKNLANAYAG